MRKLLYILSSIVLFSFTVVSNAFAEGSHDDKYTNERLAFIGTAIAFGTVFLIGYILWKKKAKATISQQAAKFRTKTYEIISHGKRMIITKKINIEPNKK